MIYGLLADLTVLFHFLWIVFLIFGLGFALIKPKIAFVHMAGLLFALIMNLMGWYCPLTYLENYLISLHDLGSTYSGSFVATYLGHIIYPDLPERTIRAGEIIFVCLYVIGYAYLGKKYHVLDRIRKR